MPSEQASMPGPPSSGACLRCFHVPKMKSAIVVGGSMAGLLAARVLSEYFEEVHVVERDTYPSAPTFRKGVPQSRHAHALLARGQDLIEHYFPGIVEDLRAAGAVRIDVPQDVLALSKYGWWPRSGSALHALSL